MLHDDVVVDDVLEPLAEAYDLLRRLQANRILYAQNAVASAERITHYLEFVAECCGKREHNYNLSGNSGMGITIANALKTISDAVDSLVCGDKGLLGGHQSTSERDPLADFYADSGINAGGHPND